MCIRDSPIPARTLRLMILGTDLACFSSSAFFPDLRWSLCAQGIDLYGLIKWILYAFYFQTRFMILRKAFLNGEPFRRQRKTSLRRFFECHVQFVNLRRFLQCVCSLLTLPYTDEGLTLETSASLSRFLWLLRVSEVVTIAIVWVFRKWVSNNTIYLRANQRTKLAKVRTPRTLRWFPDSLLLNRWSTKKRTSKRFLFFCSPTALRSPRAHPSHRPFPAGLQKYIWLSNQLD